MPPWAATSWRRLGACRPAAAYDLRVAQRGDLRGRVAELCHHFVRVLAQQRRALHFRVAVRQLDRVADRKVSPARRVVDLDDGAGRAQPLVGGDLLHRQDRPAGDVELVQDVHRLELGLRHRPLLDAREDRLQVLQARRRLGVLGVGDPAFLADDLADRRPGGRLRDEIDVGVRVRLPALALEDPARLAAARGVAGARHGLAERAVGVLRVLVHHAGAVEALLVAQLHAAQVEHGVLHRRQHLLAAAGRVALVERGDDAQRQVQPGARVADLRAGDERRAVVEARRRRRAAGALGDVLVDLAVGVLAGAEALHRRDDHARVERVDVLPGEAHAVQRAGGEILDEDVTRLDEPVDDLLALRVLRVDGDRALVVIQHREVEAVGVGHVAQLAARRVTLARLLDLDHVGAEPGQQLRAGRTGLHVGEVEDAYAIKCLAQVSSPCVVEPVAPSCVTESPSIGAVEGPDYVVCGERPGRPSGRSRHAGMNRVRPVTCPVSSDQ